MLKQYIKFVLLGMFVTLIMRQIADLVWNEIYSLDQIPYLALMLVVWMVHANVIRFYTRFLPAIRLLTLGSASVILVMGIAFYQVGIPLWSIPAGLIPTMGSVILGSFAIYWAFPKYRKDVNWWEAHRSYWAQELKFSDRIISYFWSSI